VKRRHAQRDQAAPLEWKTRSVQEVGWSGWHTPTPAPAPAPAQAPAPAVGGRPAPHTRPNGHHREAPARSRASTANRAIERVNAEYRQARVDVQTWATMELRIRCRAFRRQAANSVLDQLGYAYLQAMTEELQARGDDPRA